MGRNQTVLLLALRRREGRQSSFFLATCVFRRKWDMIPILFRTAFQSILDTVPILIGPLQKLAHQFQRSMLVSLRLDENVKDLAFGVDCAPEIDHPAADFQIDLVAMQVECGFGRRLRKSAATMGPK